MKQTDVKKSFWDLVTLILTSLLAIPVVILIDSVESRYLGAALFGKLALILSVIDIGVLFGFNWLFPAILRFGKEELVQQDNIRKTFAAFITNAVISAVILFIVILALAPFISDFFQIKHYQHLAIFPIGIFIYFLRSFVLKSLRTIRFLKHASIIEKILSKLILLLGFTLIIFQVISISIENVIIIFFTAEVISIIIGLWFIPKTYLFPFTFDKKIWKQYLKWSYPLIFSSLGGYVFTYVDLYLVNMYMELSDVGYYQAAYKMYKNVMNIIVILAIVALPIILVFKSQGEQNKIKGFYFSRLIPQITYLGIICISLLIIFSENIFFLIFSSEYSDSVLPFQFIIVGLGFQIFGSLTGVLLTAYDLLKYIVISNILMGILNIIGDIILIPHIGILGGAVTTMIAISLAAVFYLFIINKHFKTNQYFSIVIALTSVIPFILVVYVSKLAAITGLLVTSFFLLKLMQRKKIILKEDLQLYNEINMPKFVKKIIASILNYFGR